MISHEVKFHTRAIVLIGSMALVLALWSAIPASALAARFDLPNITCIPNVTCPSPLVTDADIEKNPAAYIARFYQIALAIAGILAVAIIVAGSLFYTFAGGSADRQREGKEMITSALWGIALLFGSYLILQTVNPELVILEANKPDKVTPSKQQFFDPTAALENCARWRIAGRVEPCGNVRSKEACKIEVKQYAEKLKECSDKFKNTGRGGYIYHIKGPGDTAVCHPYYKNFEKSEFYNPFATSSANGWKAGEWDFCPTQ